MIQVSIPIIVEGKYDKAKLKTIVDATVLTTDGFGIFNNAERRALIRRLGQNGVILLSDSDGGGKLIRSHLRGMLTGIPVYDLYIPQIEGKERRKPTPSKAGYLGVEGVPADTLRGIFEKFAAVHPDLCALTSHENVPAKSPLTSAGLYALGLTGRPNSADLRDAVCIRLNLPKNMTAKSFLEAVNLVASEEELQEVLSNVKL